MQKLSPKFFIYFGLLSLILAFGIGLFFYYPIIKQELKYQAFRLNNPNILDSKINLESISSLDSADQSSNFTAEDKIYLRPESQEFSLIIPKINANSKVIKNVDPFDSTQYQNALTQGIAHASTSVLPNENGNTFLFAHSSDSLYNATRYNSVFYLLNKLVVDDVFYITYNGKNYKYKVSEIKKVKPNEVQYLSGVLIPNTVLQNSPMQIPQNSEKQALENLDSNIVAQKLTKTATLMTCWPAGTTLNRLLVIGELVE